MAGEGSASGRVVVEVGRRGRLIVGEPFFAPGVPIVIDRRGLGYAGEGDLAVVRVGKGRAQVEQVLGPADRVETVLEALLVERGQRRPFEPYAPPPPSDEGRVDLRGIPAFTIDPETAKDFDDAVSVVADGSGLRVLVHIADVSRFVPAGSPLDRGAAERGFSVYVPGLVAPMLPPILADDLCSLRPHQDRPAVTVEVPLDGRLRPGPPSFYRSLIRSRARLTYAQAEAVLTGASGAEPEIEQGLRLAERVALELRRRRLARGALRIETAEIAFAFDGRGGVERAWLEAEPHAHVLVEELMILANEAVAGLLSGRGRETLYRVHERPDPQSIARLLAVLADLEVPTPPAPEPGQLSPAEAERLAAAISERVSDYVRRSGRGVEAFPALVLRSLKQARYAPRNLGHSGLASPAYCHFTSPIRRYSDLVCHRALLAEIGAADEPLPEDLPELADALSAREREVADIEYQADAICLAWFLDATLFDRGWEETFEGEIIGLAPSGMFVRFGRVFEGYLPARWLPGDYYQLSPLGTRLQGRRGGRSYRLGDGIEVRVHRVERAEGKVELRPA